MKKISHATDQMLIEVATSFPNAEAVIATDKLCGDEACQLIVDGEFLYRDAGHIRRNLPQQAKRHFADRIGLTEALARGRDGAVVRSAATNPEAQ